MRIIKKGDLLFFCSLGLYIILSVINTSLYAQYVPRLYKIGIYVSLLLLVIRELLHKMTKKRLVFMAITASVIVVSIIGQCGANTILTIMIFSISASNLEFDRIANFAYKILFVSLVFVVVSSMSGIINDYVYVMAGKSRHYLGFLYALQPAGLMFEILALNLYLNRNNKKNRQLIFLLFGTVFVFVMTKSRLTFFLQMILIVFDFMFKHKPKIFTNIILLKLEKVSYLLAVLFSFYFSITYDNSLWKQHLNLILAGRLAYARNSLVEYGVKFFGQDISWAGMGLSQNGTRTLKSVWDGYNWVDSAYVQMYQLYGIIVATFFILILTVAMFKLIKTKKYYLSFILFIYSIFGMIDTAPNTLLYNIFWLSVFYSIIIINYRLVKKKNLVTYKG